MGIRFLFEVHGHRVKNYLDWNTRLLERSRAAIRLKKLSLNNHLYNRTANVCGYLDGFRVQIARPSDTEMVLEDGVVVNLNIPTEVYSGHKMVSFDAMPCLI